VTDCNNDNDDSNTAPTRLVSVVDAVCCVHFCAAGKSSLLLKILVELDMEILIPAEVEREVLAKPLGQLKDQWRRLQSSSRVQILDELTVADARTSVVEIVARLRGMSAQLALSERRDLGEAVVIGHAKVLADAGHEVYVVIDDQGGQILASDEGLTVLTIEDLLIAAVHLGLLPSERLRKTYEDLIPFGSGLPTWEASALKQKYNEWRRSLT
jgi:predicted nucleic acid-binding protein